MFQRLNDGLSNFVIGYEALTNTIEWVLTPTEVGSSRFSSPWRVRAALKVIASARPRGFLQHVPREPGAW